jgi:YVTN family beta-propeller protein
MVYVADPGSNQISVIDSYSNTVVTTINVGTLPWGIAVNSASNIIYVTNYGSNTVTVIDGYTNAVTATIGVGTQPEGIALSPSLDEAYVANSGSNTVSVIDTTTDAVIATVAVGNVPQSIAVGPTPYTVFVTDYGSNTISVISVAAPYPSFSVTIVTVGGNPWGVAVSQLNDDVYVTNSGSGTVSVLNSLTYATVATITVGGTPQGIEIDGATATAYVADGATNTVLAINTATNTLITSTSPPIPIPVGSDPWGISILLNPGNVLYPNLGYVTNSGSNVVTVINFASNNVLAMVVAVPSTVSASISPATPSIDSGQSITLTAVPPQGTSQLYQWYTGPSCSNEILGQTASNFTTGALTSTTSYSVLVHDSVTPPGGVCASATVNVNAAFEGSAVTISPSPITIDSGQSVTLTVTWTNAGTSPYSVLLTTSTSASCTNPTSTGTLEIGLAGTSTTFTVVPPSTTYYCATATDSAYSPESSSTTSAAVVTVNPELGTPTLALSPSVIDSGQSATITATVTWSGGTSPYTVTLYSDTSSTCPSGATVVSTETDVAGTSTTFSLAAPSSTTYTYYCASVTDSATTQATVYSTVIVFTVNPALTAIVSPSAPTIDSGQSITLTATPSGGTPPYRYQWYTGPGCASTSPISGQTSSSYVTAALKSGALYSVLVTDSSSASVCASAAVAVSPALTAPTISVTPSSMSSPGSSTLSTTTSFSGGTSTYTCQWLVEAPGGSSFTDLGSSFSCTVSSLPTYSTGTLTVGTWEFELEVTDSSAVPNTVTSSPVSVTVS